MFSKRCELLSVKTKWIGHSFKISAYCINYNWPQHYENWPILIFLKLACTNFNIKWTIGPCSTRYNTANNLVRLYKWYYICITICCSYSLATTCTSIWQPQYSTYKWQIYENKIYPFTIAFERGGRGVNVKCKELHLKKRVLTSDAAP